MKMGDIGPCGPCDLSVFQVVDHKSRENNPSYRQAFVGEDQLNCNNKEIVELDLLLENLDISDDDDLNDLLLEDRENLLVEKTTCSAIPNKESSLYSSPNTPELNDLSKCAAILCSEALQSCPSINAEVELSTIQLGCESSASVSNPTEDSLVPYHSSNFVSALKGSRARQGNVLDPNLHVTWAENVYDPPVTSSSRTARGHRHRLHKAKSSDHHHKHKHMKAKPSNASNGDRKHFHRSMGIFDPRMTRLHALGRRSMQNSLALLRIEPLDIARPRGRESSKCAGIFHAESPWPFPHHIAEAS